MPMAVATAMPAIVTATAASSRRQVRAEASQRPASRAAPTSTTNQAIEATTNGDVYTGQGVTESDGKLSVDLAAGPKRTRMTGQLWPFQLEIAR